MPTVTVVDAATERPVSVDEVKEHSRIGDQTDNTLIERFIDAAADYFQEATRSSLVKRALSATFQSDELIDLPYGPLIAVLNVADRNDESITNFTLRHVGRVPRLTLGSTGGGYPITVTYNAGYHTASEIPAAVSLALLQLVGAFNEQREAVADKGKFVVPHAFEAFLRQRRRQIGLIG